MASWGGLPQPQALQQAAFHQCDLFPHLRAGAFTLTLQKIIFTPDDLSKGMTIHRSTFTLPGGKTRHEITVSKKSNWRLFEKVALFLAARLNGTWREKISGFDQAYWDLSTDHGVLTIHLEHYMGISIYAAESGISEKAEQELLDCAFDALRNFEPS